MTEQASSSTALTVSPQVKELSVLATTSETRDKLVCRNLLQGDTLLRAQQEAERVLQEMLKNTVVVSQFGRDAIRDVNELNDRMVNDRPSIDLPEVEEALRNLDRQMRGFGQKYDPSNPDVLKRYRQVRHRFLGFIQYGKTFLQELQADMRSLPEHFDRVIQIGREKQTPLMRNVAYYDEFYRLNEKEIDNLIYMIGVHEIIRDLAAHMAEAITVGDANLGDRSGEQQASILELVQKLDNKIIAYKARLWGAWGMAPVIRNMRMISDGQLSRIDTSIDVSIPTMKNTVVVWNSMGEAQAATQFNEAVDSMLNESLKGFARATGAAIPAMAQSLATPPLDPSTVLEWSNSVRAQGEGIKSAAILGHKARATLEAAMIASKQVMDETTQEVNQVLLEQVLATAHESTLEISRSVPAQS